MRLLLHPDTFLFIAGYGISKVLVQLGLVFRVHVSLLLQILNDFSLSVDLLDQPLLLSLLVSHQLLVPQRYELNVLDQLGLCFQLDLETLFELFNFNIVIFQLRARSLACCLLHNNCFGFLLLLDHSFLALFDVVCQLSALILYVFASLPQLPGLAPIYFILLTDNSLLLDLLSQKLHLESGHFIFLNNFVLDRHRLVRVKSACSVP